MSSPINTDSNAMMETKNEIDIVREVERRTLGYVDRIKACYDAQQQITGDKVITTIRLQSSSSSSNNNNNNDGTGTTQSSSIQCLRGKVRDRFIPTDISIDRIALLTTDRQSGFDRQLAVVPYKGTVLNLCSQYWFQQTQDIIPNHIIKNIHQQKTHPNVAIVQKCTPFPIEFVVRSYMTGSTSTSIWKNYQNGVRLYCGHQLEDGMIKNQKLPYNLLTPTTKEEDHDRPISLNEIIQEQWMTQDDLTICSQAAMKIFERGQQIALQHGLILVDTKYEFGRCCTTNRILLIDEVHTPDSSRYWIANTYEDRIAQGLEPDNIDKEFLRLWFNDHCDPYNDTTLPDAPSDLVVELSRRYIQLYEMITGNIFDFNSVTTDEEYIAKVIQENLLVKS